MFKNLLFHKDEDLQTDNVILEVKTSRTSEETPEAMTQLFASFTTLKKQYVPYSWWGGIPLSFELTVIDQTIRFFVTVPAKYAAYLESQIIAQYPKVLLTKVTDYIPEIIKDKDTLALGQIKLKHGYLYPIKLYSEFKDVDSLSSLLGLLSKSQPQDKIILQFMLVPIGHAWQRRGEQSASSKQKDTVGAEHANPYSKSITQKISVNGFKAAIRIAVNTESVTRSENVAMAIGNSFATYNNPTGNSLLYRKVYLWQKKTPDKKYDQKITEIYPITNSECTGTGDHVSFPDSKTFNNT